MSERKEQIRQFIVDNFLFGDDAGLENDTMFLEEGIIDSTGVLELVTFLEDTFSIDVDDEELTPENLGSIANAAAYLDQKIQS